MPIWEEFPYTNIHELNLDWIIKKVRELENDLNAGLDERIDAYIQENLSTFILNANYDDINHALVISS